MKYETYRKMVMENDLMEHATARQYNKVYKEVARFTVESQQINMEALTGIIWILSDQEYNDVYWIIKNTLKEEEE